MRVLIIIICILLLSSQLTANDALLVDNGLKSLGLPSAFIDSMSIERIKMVNLPFFTEDGKEIYIQDFHDKLLIITFWAPWSTESSILMEEFHKINQYLKQHEIFNITFIPILTNIEYITSAKSFYKVHNINFNIYFDRDRKLYEYFNIKNIPFTLIVNRNKVIVGKVSSYMKWYNADIVNALILLEKMNNIKQVS
ncbi:TlpA family protein disulfide reductase [Neoehrlichia mikurensis]|uniref:TlpA family protein disulfide reductase n=1 Tax=Neoehrlichia mikurensis TaxID=89586 RepID=A0A9Q9F4P4_9RICK|nr:TlpA disulfide reductase family protein [Neoehrlichia mikurensis]QXK92055.1 TlpA family protein disulfide reductase [Neoehrlichia mikurensis]QXK92512.1 TlpA family protein disulfide reductase [Neoehrlichia mikurensis]QXK93748.1 TlpA family protein disulfide reductase [Neoehrlichia mikurensis]UTO55281.1 TlpA family protein disulfide reductase [Neoehrlichia mikurensis]UTO56201.1 TlpA family protein disulfide reductase [Neoehrlichia mikurensis]